MFDNSFNPSTRVHPLLQIEESLQKTGIVSKSSHIAFQNNPPSQNDIDSAIANLAKNIIASHSPNYNLTTVTEIAGHYGRSYEEKFIAALQILNIPLEDQEDNINFCVTYLENNRIDLAWFQISQLMDNNIDEKYQFQRKMIKAYQTSNLLFYLHSIEEYHLEPLKVNINRKLNEDERNWVAILIDSLDDFLTETKGPLPMRAKLTSIKSYYENILNSVDQVE